MHRIKPDIGGLRRIKGRDDRIKVRNGSEVKGKRGKGTCARPVTRAGRPMEDRGSGLKAQECAGLSRI